KYVLDPVDEPMMDLFAEFVREKINLQKDEMVHEKQEYLNKITFPYMGDEFVIRYGEYGQDLVLKRDHDNTTIEENKEFITGIAKEFNAMLSKGKYQEHFID